MAVISRLDRVMADKKMRVKDLCKVVGITEANISHIRTGQVKSIRFVTLERLCRALDCTPGDLFEVVPEEPEGIVHISPYTERRLFGSRSE